MLQNIIDQQDEKYLKRDHCFHEIADDEISVASQDINDYGPEVAKKLAVQRVKDAWKIEMGKLVLN